MVKRAETVNAHAATPVRGRDANPTAAARTALIASLRARGLPASTVASIVSAGKSRRQIVGALIAYCRALPKKSG